MLCPEIALHKQFPDYCIADEEPVRRGVSHLPVTIRANGSLFRSYNRGGDPSFPEMTRLFDYDCL